MQLPTLTEAQILGVKRPIVKGIADSFNTNDGLGRLTFGTKTTVQISLAILRESFLYASGSQPVWVAIPFGQLFSKHCCNDHTSYLIYLIFINISYLKIIKSKNGTTRSFKIFFILLKGGVSHLYVAKGDRNSEKVEKHCNIAFRDQCWESKLPRIFRI